MATILIVDDQPNIVRLLQREVAAERCVVFTAATGEEALRQVRQHSPDIVLLDVMLPGMNGLDVLRAIKADPATRGTVVILLSALDEPGEMTYGLQSGADWYLIKPFAAGDVRTLVRRFLDCVRWTAPASREEGDRLPMGKGDPFISTTADASFSSREAVIARRM